MSVLEELPLIRSKGDAAKSATGPLIGPGTYDLSRTVPVNSSRAPFNSTSSRQPLVSADRALPGPGTYEVDGARREEYGEVGTRAFLSESSRFAVLKGNEVPGPGAYEVQENWNGRRNPRVHTFSAPYSSAMDAGVGTHLGPGSYNPQFAAADRKVPKAANFGKYSGREPLRPAVGPGPGSYDSLHVPQTLTATKPSSMFVTKTKRTVYRGSETPGPGTYNLDQSLQRDAFAPREQFSAFGCSTSRFAADKDADGASGPGSYTGELAPRRFKPHQGTGSAAFASSYERFPQRVANSAPGPGTYDARQLPRYNSFGEPMPFGTTVPRFSPVWSQHPVPQPIVFSGDSSGGYTPRGGVRRPFVQRKITPSIAPPPLKDRAYNVRYDWPKPTSTLDTTFGTSGRLPANALAGSDVPGPGTYSGAGGLAGAGQRGGNSTWGRDVRFATTAPVSGTPDPGKYYHASTLLTKSHNATIGSDTTWIG